MGVDADFVGRMGPQLELLLPLLDEKSRRLVLGAVARAAEGGRGHRGRGRDRGGLGRRSLTAWLTWRSGRGSPVQAGPAGPAGGAQAGWREHDPRLTAAMSGLLEESSRGDPMSLLLWTTLSARDIAAELTRQGHPCGRDAVLRMLRAEGFSTQGNSRTIEGKRHPDRDAQFRYIEVTAKQYLAAGDPVISVDTKKKEQVGQYANAGRCWRPAATRCGSAIDDFPDPIEGKVAPYGSTTSGTTPGSSTSAPTTTPPRSRWSRSAAGGTPPAGTAIRAPGGCWSPATRAAPTATAPGRGRRNWPRWPRRRA